MGNANCGASIAGDLVATAGCVALAPVPPAAAACAALAGFNLGVKASEVCGGAGAPPAAGGRRKRSYPKNTSPRFVEFEAYDINRDGYISDGDIPPVVTSPNLKMMLISIMMTLPLVDTDNDGRMSQSEALIFRDTTQRDQDQLQWMYDFLDSNRDNRVTPNEMVQVMGTCSLATDKTNAWDGYRQMMETLKCIKKGYVDFQDIWNWYSNQPKQPGQDTLWNFQSLRRKYGAGYKQPADNLTPWQAKQYNYPIKPSVKG